MEAGLCAAIVQTFAGAIAHAAFSGLRIRHKSKTRTNQLRGGKLSYNRWLSMVKEAGFSRGMREEHAVHTAKTLRRWNVKTWKCLFLRANKAFRPLSQTGGIGDAFLSAYETTPYENKNCADRSGCCHVGRLHCERIKHGADEGKDYGLARPPTDSDGSAPKGRD
jgi:hypothetical protein